MNLRTKFQLASASLVLIVVLGVMSSLYISERKKLLNQFSLEQQAELAKLSKVCDESLLKVDDELVLFNYARTLTVFPTISYVGYSNKEGTYAWIQDKNSLHYLTTDPWLDITPILKENRFIRRDVVTADDERIIEVSQPIKGKAYVILGYSKNAVLGILDKSLGETVQVLSITGFIAILFGFLIAQLLSRALARPIDRLMKAAVEISHGKKGIQIQEQGTDELGRLTSTFNEMSRELTKLDELKDDFMGHVTHELRSPLTSIIATVELLSEMPLAGKDPKFKRSIDRLIYGSERLNRLVDNILDLTRMEAGKMPFDIQPINIATVVNEMADFFEPRAMEKGLKISAMAPNNLPLVMADVEKIRQVLSNLIYNAIKFTNAGGIVVWAKQVDQSIHIGVQDTGVGIPKEKMHTLFQKFGTLKDTKDRVNKPVPGTGLGLVIVKNSIESQGGKIWVESEMDKGSTFIFSLPVAAADLQQKSSSPSGLSATTSMLSNRESLPPKNEQAHKAVIMDEPEKRAVV